MRAPGWLSRCCVRMWEGCGLVFLVRAQPWRGMLRMQPDQPAHILNQRQLSQTGCCVRLSNKVRNQRWLNYFTLRGYGGGGEGGVGLHGREIWRRCLWNCPVTLRVFLDLFIYIDINQHKLYPINESKSYILLWKSVTSPLVSPQVFSVTLNAMPGGLGLWAVSRPLWITFRRYKSWTK